MRSPRSHRRRAVVAALALAALTATPALAMPDRGSVGMPSPAGTTSASRLDLRSPDAVDASIPGRASHPRQPLPGPPTWPIHPVPFTPAGQSPAAHDDGTPCRRSGSA